MKQSEQFVRFFHLLMDKEEFSPAFWKQKTRSYSNKFYNIGGPRSSNMPSRIDVKLKELLRENKLPERRKKGKS